MDMSQYLETFLADAAECLQSLNDNLLVMEKDPQNGEVLGEIFRSAHTLKGMAATMGFKGIAELTHEMESTLDLLRRQALVATPEVVDVLLKCLDALESMVASVRDEGGDEAFDHSRLTAELRRLQNQGSKPPTPNGLARVGGGEQPGDNRPEAGADSSGNGWSYTKSELDVLEQARREGYRAYHARLSLDPETIMKAPRVFMVFKAIEDLSGEVIKSDPPVEDLEDEKFESGFELLFISKEPAAAFRESLGRIAEVNLESLEEVAFNRVSTAAAGSPDGQEVGGKQARNSHETRNAINLKTVRVDTERLDNLLNLVGELVINKTRLEQLSAGVRSGELQDAVDHMGRLTSDLQSLVMKIRMVPVEQVFNRFPRMVRDLSRELGKQISFEIQGEETELDRTVIDEIGEPLVHLLRNSIDHGIEPPDERLRRGKPETSVLRLAARHEGNNVIIEVSDDGRGIDLERVRARAVQRGLLTGDQNPGREALLSLLFEPGFSTAEEVTDISGRGVGMDVVKKKVEALNGSIELETGEGTGTTTRIRLPLTLAIIQAMLVQVGEERYAIPLGVIDETAILNREQIKKVQHQEVMLLREKVLPLVSLAERLQVEGRECQEKELFVVVVRRGGRQYGLVVDSLLGQQDIVIKSLGKWLKGIPGLAGATILGDGQVSLILDIDSLF